MVRCKLCTGRQRVLINPRARPCDEQVIRTTRGAADCTARERRWVLVATILASVIAYIDESVVNVALPAIAKDLATSVAVIQWVINAYTLCLAAFLLVGGCRRRSAWPPRRVHRRHRCFRHGLGLVWFFSQRD